MADIRQEAAFRFTGLFCDLPGPFDFPYYSAVLGDIPEGRHGGIRGNLAGPKEGFGVYRQPAVGAVGTHNL